MSASERTLGWLLSESASDTGVDRGALAKVLLEAARKADETQAQLDREAALARRAPLEELRSLLMGREIETLARLREAIDDPERFAAAVGHALPSAAAQAAARDERLADVLAPTFERAAQRSIRKDPRTLVDILHPVIVPAIRKAIGEAIDGTFQSLNESLKHAFTLRGLRWRLRAWRTGVPFAQIVLEQTLTFRVEHVFLIHRHTGLLIAQATAADATSRDPQLVSSMLVAIQDFVRDSFAASEGALDALRHGELLLWCEQGPSASLVAVIRGNPPAALHDTLREVLARIHEERGQALASFDGDSAPFADVAATLEECASLRQLAPRARAAGTPWPLAIVALFALGFGIDAWQRSQHEGELWDRYVQRLRTEPGIVVAEARKVGDGWRLSGLRDPLAADPRQLLALSGIDPSRVVEHWQPYQALNPPLVLQRLKASLAPPPTVTLASEGEAIVASGTASAAWLQKARAFARALPPGWPPLDVSGIGELNDARLERLRTAIEAHVLRFGVNEVMPAGESDATLDALAGEIRQLAARAGELRVNSRVTITGHSDSTGKGTTNLSLSVSRAEVVRTLLIRRGVAPEMAALNTLRSGSLAGVDPRDPGKVMAGLNRLYPMASHNDLFFTLWYGVYSLAERRLVHASAGHPPALLVHPQAASRADPRGLRRAEPLAMRGPPVGTVPGAAWRSGSTLVPEGSRLFLFSDGAFEIRRCDGSMLPFDAFAGLVSSLANEPVESGLDRLLGHLRRQAAGGELDDDLSIVCFAL